jgi:hypothetical protein
MAFDPVGYFNADYAGSRPDLTFAMNLMGTVMVDQIANTHGIFALIFPQNPFKFAAARLTNQFGIRLGVRPQTCCGGRQTW